LTGCDAGIHDFITVHGFHGGTRPGNETRGDVVWLRHSASGVEFVSHGGKIDVAVTQGDLLHKNDPRVFPRVAFYVNGERVIDDVIDISEKIFSLDVEKEAVCKIIKLSEGHMSTAGVRLLRVESPVTPVPERDLLIEFIGDSITTGYGVDGSRDDHFTTATQDVTKTYAYKTAQALNAGLRIAAVSGSGVVSGSTADGTKNPHHIMPLYYDWDNPPARPPDIIVINLGTNDAGYTRRDAAREAEFTEAYAAFLQRLRGLYPEAKIVCALGIMGDGLYRAMEEAVGVFGDKNTVLLRFDNQQAEDGYGSGWHPSETTHEKAAGKLIELLREIMQFPH
jgi:lysophospholipase L1-like esterase